jgi:hypothetical protein
MKRVVLRGGLGNQLFGLAFADTVASLSGGPVGLNLSAFANDAHGRGFECGALANDYGLAVDTRPLGRVGQTREGRPPTDAHGLAQWVQSGAVFNGYWQNEAWFARPDVVRARTRDFLDRLAPTAPIHDVVIHYRVYGEERLPWRRAGSGARYVRRALDRIETVHGKTLDIFLVSDDPGRAMAALGAIGQGVTPSSGGVGEDMSILLRARALVLSNSSFAWWAGYCGDATLATYPRRQAHFHYPAPASRFEVI